MSRRAGTRVFVGGLSYRVRERDLEKFFQSIGRVTDISMKNGYAFVEFDDHRDADDAVYELNGKDLLGERVAVEHIRGPGYRRDTSHYGPPPRSRGRWADKDDHRTSERYGPPTRTDYRLIVENLSSRVSWQDLKDYMRSAGEVTYADAHKQRRNEGVVEFASYSDMKTALDRLDDTELNGRRIRLVEDRRRGRRSRSSTSRSRSKSRSRGRSKSRSRSSRSRSRSKSAKSKSRSRSKSRSAAKNGSKSRSPNQKKKSRSRSRSPATHKRAKRSVSDSPPPGKRSKSDTPDRNGNRSAGSGDDD